MSGYLPGIALIALGLCLSVAALWEETPPSSALDRIRQFGLPIGLALAQAGALLVAVPGFFGP